MNTERLGGNCCSSTGWKTWKNGAQEGGDGACPPAELLLLLLVSCYLFVLVAIWVTLSSRDIIPKTVLFFQSLTVNFFYMVHCREPIFFCGFGFELTFITRKCNHNPMLLWGKMCPYLLSKHTFYPLAT